MDKRVRQCFSQRFAEWSTTPVSSLMETIRQLHGRHACPLRWGHILRSELLLCRLCKAGSKKPRSPKIIRSWISSKLLSNQENLFRHVNLSDGTARKPPDRLAIHYWIPCLNITGVVDAHNSKDQSQARFHRLIKRQISLVYQFSPR